MFTKSELFSTNQNRELVYSFMSAKFIGLLCRLQLGGDVQACLEVVMGVCHQYHFPHKICMLIPLCSSYLPTRTNISFAYASIKKF